MLDSLRSGQQAGIEGGRAFVFLHHLLPFRDDAHNGIAGFAAGRLIDFGEDFFKPLDMAFSLAFMLLECGAKFVRLVAQDIDKDAAIILMDSKGDLIEPFLQLASIRHRLVVVGPDNPVGLNPLDIPHQDINKAVDNLEYLFSSLLEFKLTGTQSMPLLRAVLRALVSSFKQPTLETFRDILANGVKAYPQQIQSLPPDLRDFFAKEFDTENIKHRRQEVLQRLRLLLDNDVMKEMLLAPFTTFHIGEAMDDGKIIIIDNSKGKLGEQAAEFFGRFFIAQVLAAAQQRSFRPASTKRPVYFYIDEAQSVIARDEKITTVLHECRAQKIALILAHQEMVQLSDKVLSAVQNCAIRFANPDEEAPKLVRTLRTDIDQLRALKKGQFAGYIRTTSSRIGASLLMWSRRIFIIALTSNRPNR